MIKHLTPIGNSLCLIIDRPILELLRIDADTPLEVRTDGEALVIRPARPDHEERVRRAAERMMDAHETALGRLSG